MLSYLRPGLINCYRFLIIRCAMASPERRGEVRRVCENQIDDIKHVAANAAFDVTHGGPERSSKRDIKCAKMLMFMHINPGRVGMQSGEHRACN
jgi:orotidine-5'-phosphate decarboxylase